MLHIPLRDNNLFMSEYLGVNSSYQSGSASANRSGSSSTLPDSRTRALAIPNIKSESADKLLSKSGDIKKQLSQSLYGSSGPSGSSGGVSKPHSRKNSIIAMKSDEDDEEDDEDQGNERKRRDNINDKIQELLTLIPPELFQESAPAVHSGLVYDQEAEISAAVKNSGTKDGKPNKGQILTKSVEYLQYLQNLIDENNRKEVELAMKLRRLQGHGTAEHEGHTSAEQALGEIGVGPLSDAYFKLVLVSSVSASKARRGSVG